MTDPLSISTSAVALLAACRSIGQFIATLIREKGPDSTIDALRADVDSLSTDVALVRDNRNTTQSSSVQQNVIWKRIETEQHDCDKTLRELKDFLMPLRRDVRSAIVIQLRSETVQGLRARISKHQQSLHFYVTLIVK
jgi:hypothetical protein